MNARLLAGPDARSNIHKALSRWRGETAMLRLRRLFLGATFLLAAALVVEERVFAKPNLGKKLGGRLTRLFGGPRVTVRAQGVAPRCPRLFRPKLEDIDLPACGRDLDAKPGQ